MIILIHTMSLWQHWTIGTQGWESRYGKPSHMSGLLKCCILGVRLQWSCADPCGCCSGQTTDHWWSQQTGNPQQNPQHLDLTADFFFPIEFNRGKYATNPCTVCDRNIYVADLQFNFRAKFCSMWMRFVQIFRSAFALRVNVALANMHNIHKGGVNGTYSSNYQRSQRAHMQDFVFFSLYFSPYFLPDRLALLQKVTRHTYRLL